MKLLSKPGREVSVNNEMGQSAVFGVFLLLIFAAYGIVTVMNMTEESSSVIYGFRSREARYAAEAGLEYAIEEIKAGTNNAGNISNLMIGGTHVDVTNNNDTLLSAVAVTRTPSVTRTIKLKIDVSRLPAAMFYAFYVSKEKNLRMQANCKISGNVLFNGSTLSVDRRMSFSKSVLFVPRSTSVRYTGGTPITRHNYMYLNEPPDDFPKLDTRYYDAYVNNIYGYESVGPVIKSKTRLKDFKDGVLYREGDLKINARIEGPGIICASGTISIVKDEKIGPDVQIISGKDIKMSTGTVTSGKTIASLMFARGTIVLSNVDVSAMVLSIGGITLRSKVNLQGICYTSRRLSLKGDYKIEGSVVTNRVSRFRGRGSITFSEDTLNGLSIPGLSGRLKVSRNGWKEV